MITHEQLKILYDKCKNEEYIDIGRLSTYINLHFQQQQEKKDERAKKVEEELEECKISDKSKEESSIEYYNLYKETKRKLKKVEELLLIYKQYYKGYLSPEDQKRRQDLEKELRGE